MIGSGAAGSSCRTWTLRAWARSRWWLAMAIALALAALAAVPAHAVNECGAGTTVTCTSAGNPYSNGITYANPTVSVTLSTGVIVNSGANTGVDLIGSTGAQSLTVGTGVPISTTGDNADGVFAQSSGVGALVKIDTSAGSVGTLGGAANGIAASSSAGPVMITTGSVSTQGFLAEGVFGGTMATGANGALTIDTTAG